MENRCGLCGCKTDALDLTEYQFPTGEKSNVCGYCRKQLLSFSKNPNVNSQWARDVFATDTKGARSPQTSAAFFKLMQASGISPSRQSYTDEAAIPPKADALAPVNSSDGSSLSELEQVKKQLNELNTKFEKFKKRYYLSKILGVVLPIVFVIIMIIILFASGAFQNIFDYYAQLSDYANY